MSDDLSSSVSLSEPPASERASQPRLYYGWVMVAVAAVALVATLPGRTFGLGMITERLLAETSLGLTRTSYAFVNLWATLLGALFCLGFGRAIDRFGVRIVLTLVLCLLGLTVWSMTAFSGVVAFFILLTLTRGLGQSALSVVSLSIVGKWFVRRLSWAMAIYSVLMGLGFAGAAKLGGKFADADWRVFWGWLGAIVFLLGPLAWLVTRNSPEQLAVDGAPAGENSTLDSDRSVSLTLLEAMRTPSFWVFGLATSLFGLVSSGVMLFNESILAERGFPKEAYFQSLEMGFYVGLAGNFLAGWLASFWSIARLTALGLVALAGALVWLTFLQGDGQLKGYVVVNALAGSIITLVFFTVWAKFYGRTHLGRIQGMAQMLTVLASPIGPVLLGASKDRYATYAPVLWMLAGCTAVLAVIAWYTPLPMAATSAADLRETVAANELQGTRS